MRLLGRFEDDLFTTQHKPRGDFRQEQRETLPGVDARRRTPAPSRGAPEWPGSGDHQSVRPEWRNIVPGADDRTWDARAGAAVEASRSPGPPLRAVQPPPGDTRAAGIAGATIPPPDAISSAIGKASEGEWWRLVSWQADWQCYLVPSRTEPGQSYRVGRRPGARRDDPWWWRYTCDCKAHTSGKYLACWHKAACHLALTRVYRPKGGGPAPTV